MGHLEELKTSKVELDRLTAIRNQRNAFVDQKHGQAFNILLETKKKLETEVGNLKV